MLAVLNHPRLLYDWFSTTLLRWNDGLVIYDRWRIGLDGVTEWKRVHGASGEVLLDVYYGCYLIAFIGVIYFFERYRKKGWIKIQPWVTYDALILAMIGVLVGAKTAYIFIYNPEFYFGDPPYGPIDFGDQMRRIFLNWSGMASHGAATGIVIMALLWWLKSRPPIAQIGDLGCLSGAFGAIWIRFANFMNGELYGRAASADLPWAMRFPVKSGKGHDVVWNKGVLYEQMLKPENPDQVEAWMKTLEAANPKGVIDSGSNYVFYKNPDAYLQGFDVVTGAKGDPVFVAPADMPDNSFGFFDVVTTPRHPSQVYQLILEGVLLFLFLLFLRARVKRAGMVAGGFFMGYAVARFIGEFWRQPDVQFQQHGNEMGTRLFDLSTGQWLSFAMFAFGLGFFLYHKYRGKLISEMPMWPPDEPKDEPSAPADPGAGGSSAAGNLAGLTEVREALEEKQKEWDKGAEQPPKN